MDQTRKTLLPISMPRLVVCGLELDSVGRHPHGAYGWLLMLKRVCLATEKKLGADNRKYKWAQRSQKGSLDARTQDTMTRWAAGRYS